MSSVGATHVDTSVEVVGRRAFFLACPVYFDRQIGIVDRERRTVQDGSHNRYRAPEAVAPRWLVSGTLVAVVERETEQAVRRWLRGTKQPHG